jgi:hypothetical protein
VPVTRYGVVGVVQFYYMRGIYFQSEIIPASGSSAVVRVAFDFPPGLKAMRDS